MKQRPPHFRTGERGAAVLLFVALVVAAAIAATASMMIGRPQFAVQQATGTGFDMTALRKAVEAHALVVGGGIVACPDTTGDGVEDCTGTNEGPVPWRTIGVTQRQASDAWGQDVRIIVPASGTLSLVPAQGATESACHFILISSGANRVWDYAPDPLATANTVTLTAVAALTSPADTDIAVCGKLGQDSAEDETPPESAEETTVFDGPPVSYVMTQDTTNNIAPRFKTAPHADWAVGDEVLYIGGSSNSPDTYDLTAGNVEKTACAWFEEPFDFTTQTLRGFIRFQFLPGESVATQIKNTGQGFALMVIPGDRVVSSSTCGSANVNNAYGFKGIPRPKFALEFDIYRDGYEGATDTNGRNNPRPEGNHVALLNPWTNDHISHGGSENPPCHTWGAYNNGPALNGSRGACTYPPGNPSDYASGQAEARPARHVVRPAHWLEDGQYFDTALNQNAAQPYAVRFEFKRLCNADCSVCGVDGNTNVHAKAWVSCDGSVTTPNLVSNCPTISTALQDTNALYGGTTDYMVNHCMPDRGLTFAQSFDTVKVGIGFSTLDSAVALLLHRFEVKSE
ncbi:MAG: hypothetical protein VR70_17225 [Rhodospirillaceae bacterium BRH_c57]|nr:MAG: hypothetical protein VR70_17225 [Rhodospirillaceae bacterium BRH_c57]